MSFLRFFLFLCSFYLGTQTATADWIYTNGPGSNQRVMRIYVYNGIVYAGTIFSGLYRSSDQGDTWDNVTSLPASNIRFVGSIGQTLVVSSFGSGIYVSTDDGTTWEQRNEGLDPDGTGTVISTSLILDSEEWYTFGIGAVHRTTNKGMSWSLVSTELQGEVLSFRTNNGVLWAGTTTGLFRSLDRGATWTLESGEFLHQTITTIEFDESSVIVGTPAGVLRSPDRGESWTDIDCPFQNFVGLQLLNVGTQLIATSSSGVYVSNNQGMTWDTLGGGTGGSFPFSIAYHDNALYGGSYNGVYRITIPVVSVDDEVRSAQYSVYPNPATTYFVVDASESADLPLLVNVCDLYGRTIHTVTLHTDHARSQLDLPSGVYSIRAEDGRGRLRTSIVVVQK